MKINMMRNESNIQITYISVQCHTYVYIYMRISTTLKALTPKTGDPEELWPVLFRLRRHQHPRCGHCCRKAGGNDSGRGGGRHDILGHGGWANPSCCGEVFYGFLGVETTSLQNKETYLESIQPWRDVGLEIFLCVCKISGISKVILRTFFRGGQPWCLIIVPDTGEDRVQPPAFRMVPDQASFVRAATTRWGLGRAKGWKRLWYPLVN